MRSRVSIIGIRRRGNFRLAERDQNRAMPNTLPKNSDSRSSSAAEELAAFESAIAVMQTRTAAGRIAQIADLSALRQFSFGRSPSIVPISTEDWSGSRRASFSKALALRLTPRSMPPQSPRRSGCSARAQ